LIRSKAASVRRRFQAGNQSLFIEIGVYPVTWTSEAQYCKGSINNYEYPVFLSAGSPGFSMVAVGF
jgi:hypothetical protein